MQTGMVSRSPVRKKANYICFSAPRTAFCCRSATRCLKWRHICSRDRSYSSHSIFNQVTICQPKREKPEMDELGDNFSSLRICRCCALPVASMPAPTPSVENQVLTETTRLDATISLVKTIVDSYTVNGRSAAVLLPNERSRRSVKQRGWR
ncbi:hypothetical protein EJ03DRAFT_40266 [Teratosphaeria nubilosa]|uniref:Uncharacterized protein n=1 Tax=Teratosphaeria nubilosa TaxID=161662 RepID=A0A6G1KVT1_9PEZI|nr:hypothetical protein EJ03DRAFT_40266 [Teratosphaeria nubilosa]